MANKSIMTDTMKCERCHNMCSKDDLLTYCPDEDTVQLVCRDRNACDTSIRTNDPNFSS